MKTSIRCAILSVALIATSVPVYADDFAIAISPSSNQTIRYDHGVASIDSVQKYSIVRIVNIAGNDKKSVSFVIGILNTSGQPLNFGPENITVRPTGMQSIALTTYEEAMEAERKKEGREKFWSRVGAIGRGLSASNAGTTYTSGTYGGTTSGWVGNDLVTAQTGGTYSGTQYNSGAALAAQRNAQEMNVQDRANLEQKWANRTAATNNLLRTTTVDPGTMYGGIATFPIGKELKKTKGRVQVTIEIDVAGERHIFLAQLSDGPMSGAAARVVEQRPPVARPLAGVTKGPTLELRLQTTVSYIRRQIPSRVGGNGNLIDVQSQGSQLLFVVKFDQAPVPAEGKIKLQEVCTSELTAPLLKEGATFHVTYVDRTGARIGVENVYPSDCGFR